jgi:hypothetical protein
MRAKLIFNLALFFFLPFNIFFVFLWTKKYLAMKKHFFTALILLCLGISTFSCGGRRDASETIDETADSIATETDSLTPTATSNATGPMVKAASADNMKMVLDNMGNVVGRYVSTNENTYTVSVQDDFDVPKAGHKVVVFSAANKQGILYTRRTHVNVRQQPTTESPVVTQISYEKGSVPVTYPCIGKVNDWYKIRVKGKEGFVRQDLVEWDGMDTF